jgi:hypothetical protein
MWMTITDLMKLTLCHDLYHQMKMALGRLWKRYNLKLICFVCYIQSDWSKKLITRIYHIFKYSWHRVTCMWPVWWFLQISHTAIYQRVKKRSSLIIIYEILVKSIARCNIPKHNYWISYIKWNTISVLNDS